MSDVGTRSLPFTFAASGTIQLDNGHGLVRRLSVRETTGTTTATIDVYDGSGTGGILIDSIALSAGQSTRDYYLKDEYPYDGGLFLNVTGACKGTYVVRPGRWEWGEAMPCVIIGEVDVNVSSGLV
jgi:hypothetical protein